MKTYTARTIAPVVVILTLAWAVPCLSQDLNIEIAVPEPGRGAAEGKEAGRRKHSQRNESPQGARRNSRLPLAEAPPALDLDFVQESAVVPDRLSERPTLAPPKNKASRPWPASAADEGPEREPAWANPAGIPLRLERNAGAAPTPQSRDKQPAAKAPTAKTSKSRGESKGVSGHNRWLSRWFQSSRRDTQQEEPPLLARRQRASTADPAQESGARPSPLSKGRQPEPDRE